MEPLLLYMPLLIMQMFWTLVSQCAEIFSVQFGSVAIFFIVHIDDHFIIAQICQAHFNEKWE